MSEQQPKEPYNSVRNKPVKQRTLGESWVGPSCPVHSVSLNLTTVGSPTTQDSPAHLTRRDRHRTRRRLPLRPARARRAAAIRQGVQEAPSGARGRDEGGSAAVNGTPNFFYTPQLYSMEDNIKREHGTTRVDKDG